MKKADDIIEIMIKAYPDVKCALNFNSPYELLIATILSAQCTDIRVNIITSELFKKYNNPYSMTELSEEAIGEIIKSCGLYKNKSKNILAASKILVEEYQGKVPGTMEELINLPGVGRKTANVVLSNAFNVPAIAVDTHVFRVSNRLGIGKGKTPEEVEKQLMKNVPRNLWSLSHHLIIKHGREVCSARNPKCSECKVKEYCDYFSQNKI